jgi:hypothetical protein
LYGLPYNRIMPGCACAVKHKLFDELENQVGIREVGVQK